MVMVVARVEGLGRDAFAPERADGPQAHNVNGSAAKGSARRSIADFLS
ncbi:MAG TPA: hypothetical protein VKO86_16240 [Gemmatimonadales bacterium]|nr:hypothetical protein [Gemmatimonadales bacterium]